MIARKKAQITTIIASLPEHLLFSTKRSPGWCWLAIRRGDKRVQRCTHINVETALLYLSNRHSYVCVHFHLKSTSSMNEVGTPVKTGCALTDMQHNAVQLLHNSLTTQHRHASAVHPDDSRWWLIASTEGCRCHRHRLNCLSNPPHSNGFGRDIVRKSSFTKL